MKHFQRLNKGINANTKETSAAASVSKSPSLKTTVLYIVIYLFGTFPIIAVLTTIINSIGSGGGANREINLFATTLIVQVILICIMTYLLVRRYKSYLFPEVSKANLYRNFIIGIKWSILFIISNGVGIFFLTIRTKWLSQYLTMTNMSFGNISLTNVILFSITLMFISMFEELIFRGIVQQKLSRVLSPSLSVLTTSGIFALSHCIYYPVTIMAFINWYLVGVFSGFAFNESHSCTSSFIPHLMSNARYIILTPFILV